MIQKIMRSTPSKNFYSGTSKEFCIFQLGNHKKKCLNEKANTNACDATSASTDKRRRLLKAKERQATLLLGLILSAFIISWLPFFVSALFELHPLARKTCEIMFFFEKESTSPKTQKLSKHLTDYVKTTANENQNRGASYLGNEICNASAIYSLGLFINMGRFFALAFVRKFISTLVVQCVLSWFLIQRNVAFTYL